MVVALASIFDGKALEKYNAETDRILTDTTLNDTPPVFAEPVQAAGTTKKEPKQAATTARTMHELSKLNSLLRRK